MTEFNRIIDVSWNKKLVPGKTLLFIDEIQEAPHLVKLLRFFKEDSPELHVIAAGSLFEVKLKEMHISLPVGRVEYAYLYPLDFFEFLHAKGDQSLLNYLQQISLKDAIPEALHHQALSKYHQYALVGGMPEAVAAYINSSLASINSIYSNLTVSYQDDVYKYAISANAKYLLWVLDQAPLAAGTTITYEKFAQSQYRSREMSEAFRTLAAAMLLYQVPATKNATLPLTPQIKKPSKLLFLDVGLVNAQMGIQAEYLNIKNLTDFYQGRIAEQMVGQQLLASLVESRLKLFYWYKKSTSEAELDFCISHQGKPLGFEVKSGTSGRLKSMWEFAKSTSAITGVRVYSGPLTVEERTIGDKEFRLISMPFYLFPRWQELVD